MNSGERRHRAKRTTSLDRCGDYLQKVLRYMELCESCEHAWFKEACLLAVIVNCSCNDYIRNINCVRRIWNSTKERF